MAGIGSRTFRRWSTGNRAWRIETSAELVLHQGSVNPGDDHAVRVEPDQDLAIYGDVVRVRGRVAAPGRSLSIFARRIVAENDAAGTAPELNVDGASGAEPPAAKVRPDKGANGEPGVSYSQPFPSGEDKPGGAGAGADTRPEMRGEDGKEGAPGGAGGAITVSCGELAGTGLRLSAAGGRGGNGQAGQPGAEGGDGGPGADGETSSGFLALGRSRPTAGGNGGRGGDGGRGGVAGRGGRGGRITVSVLESGIELPAPVVAGGPSGEPGQGGGAGAGGAPGAGGRWYNPGFKEEHKYIKGVDGLVNAQLGARGLGGARGDPGKAADPAGAGSAKVELSSPPGPVAALASLPQLQMIFRKVRSRHLEGSEEALAEAVPLLQWLHMVLEAALASPEGEAPFAPGAERQAAQGLLDTAAATFERLLMGKDFFGHDTTHVPTVSIDLYVETLATLTATLEKLEAARDERAADHAEATATRSRLGALQEQARRHRGTYLEPELGRVVKETGDLGSDINAAAAAVHEARKALFAAIERFGHEVEAVFGLTPEKVLETMGQLAFLDSERSFNKYNMILGQTGQLARAALEDAVTDTGASVGKRQVTHQLGIMRRDVDSLGAGFSMAVKSNHITVSDPNAYKVLQLKSDFFRLCDNFYDRYPEARVAEAAMTAYVERIQHRNALILRYNDLLARRRELEGELEQTGGELAGIGERLGAAADPGLVETARFAEALYGRVKEACIRELYLASRAYAFWSLEADDALGEVLSLGRPDDIDAAVIATAAADLLHGRVETLERRCRPSQTRSWRVELTGLSHPEVLATLRRAPHVAEFDLRPATAETTRATSPFAGSANVRITRVRCWARGMATADDLLTILVTHLGNEKIVGQDGEAVPFEHSRVPTGFTYDARAKPETDAALGRTGTSDGDLWEPGKPIQAYTPIGPFTRWRISILEKNNAGLDLRGLRSVALEFKGMCDTFHGDVNIAR